MPERVVVRLEVVEIQHGDGQGASVLIRRLLGPFELVVEGASVRQAGQCIRPRQGRQLLGLALHDAEQQPDSPQDEQHDEDGEERPREQPSLSLAHIRGVHREQDGQGERAQGERSGTHGTRGVVGRVVCLR